MLINLREYHRPGAQEGLDRALELLARRDVRTVPLAGGDWLVGSADRDIEAVVDLQDLGLDAIALEEGGAALFIGAMATRAALAVHADARQAWNGIIADGARRWGGNVQRNRATIGGAVAVAAPDDPLLVALLGCDAHVLLHGCDGLSEMSLAEFLPRAGELLDGPRLIVGLKAPTGLHAGACGAALAVVARTPADRPIVVAAATLEVSAGRCTRARLAVGGVAPLWPVRLPQAEQMLEGRPVTLELARLAAGRAAGSLHPPGDYRGSAEYRRAMVAVLAQRALSEAWSRAR